jgi:hypothetical protein
VIRLPTGSTSVAKRSRVARWGFVAASAFGTWCVIQTVVLERFEASVWSLGVTLGEALRVVPQEPRVDWDALEREVAASEPSGVSITDTTEAPAVGNKGERLAKAQKAAPKGLFVSAEQVLRLSRVAKIPASRFVAKTGERPFGLQVAGISGLGIGVQDGDVLTQVAGAPVNSSAAVISTVLKLRAKHAPAVSGEFWRGQERFQIVFQMPYVTPGAEPSGSTANAAPPSVTERKPADPAIASN